MARSDAEADLDPSPGWLAGTAAPGGLDEHERRSPLAHGPRERGMARTPVTPGTGRQGGSICSGGRQPLKPGGAVCTTACAS